MTLIITFQPTINNRKDYFHCLDLDNLVVVVVVEVVVEVVDNLVVEDNLVVGILVEDNVVVGILVVVDNLVVDNLVVDMVDIVLEQDVALVSLDRVCWQR